MAPQAMQDLTARAALRVNNVLACTPAGPAPEKTGRPPRLRPTRSFDARLTARRTALSFSHPRAMAVVLAKRLGIGLLAAALAFSHMVAARDLGRSAAADAQASAGGHGLQPGSKQARFLGEPASDDTRHVADWVTTWGDNRSLPFIIIDKVNAEVFVFDAGGELRGASRALLGLARGDDSVPGIGERKMSSIRPEERTTPAGRFVASLGHNTDNQDILWVDYANAIALHRVVTTNPKERRVQRLAMASPLDRRISFGCINVPAKFYDKVVIPAFIGTKGIVYVLPETRSIREVFVGLSR
jgi:hypothetical protein